MFARTDKKSLTYCIYIRYNNANKLLYRQTKGDKMQYSQISPALQDDRTLGEWIHMALNAPLHDQIASIILLIVIGSVMSVRRARR